MKKINKVLACVGTAMLLGASVTAMAAEVDFTGQSGKSAAATASKEVDFTGTKTAAGKTTAQAGQTSKEVDFSNIKSENIEQKEVHLRPSYANKSNNTTTSKSTAGQSTNRTSTSSKNTKEVSSIDAIDKGVADTGETNYSNKDAEIVPSTAGYTLAVLPYVDTSGLEGRSREMAVGAVKDNLKIKYDSKKSNVQVVSSAAVQNAMARYPMENAESPTLDELVKIGEACGADRVIFVNILPARQKESGFMVVVGTQTYSSTVTMKLKCVDVNNEEYLFNQNVEGVGSSSSVNFWRIGEPSHAKAVKRGVTECMTLFLTSFD